jgi:hypothetical protein
MAVSLYRIFTEQLIGVHVTNNLLIFKARVDCHLYKVQCTLLVRYFFPACSEISPCVCAVENETKKSIIPIHHVSIVFPLELEERTERQAHVDC